MCVERRPERSGEMRVPGGADGGGDP